MRHISGGAPSHPICAQNSSGAMRSPRKEVSSACPPSLSTMNCSLATIVSISYGSASQPIPKTSAHDQKGSAGDRRWSRNGLRHSPALRRRAVPVGNSHSYILMVQSAQNWHGQRATDGLDGAGMSLGECLDQSGQGKLDVPTGDVLQQVRLVGCIEPGEVE